MLGKIVVGDGVPDVPFPSVRSIPFVKLSAYGEITQKHIIAIDEHYDSISIDKYVIMPNHVHMLICIHDLNEDGTPSSAHMGIPALISVFKRFVHKECGFMLFQRSYHDHIVRNENEYQRIGRYIDENPMRWEQDEYYR